MTRTIPVLAAVALGLTACDLSQKKPETTTAVRAAHVSATPAAPAMQAPARSPGDSAGSERSVRLYGPGVSRKRQTRI